MFRLLLFISILIFSLMIHEEGNAAIVYNPGATIAMTGSNSSVRFDIASDLFGFDATAPVLTTATRKFTGTFYGSGIGWIEFSTGTYQVSLNCGAQSLSGLTMNCTLTGTGWSENVGDIYFSSGTTVLYNPTTGLLSGSILSFVGDIDLSGISLPLRPVNINDTILLADHNTTLSVSGAGLYEGGTTPWEMKITPTLSSDILISGVHGIFLADLSLASTYDVMITDTNNSTTQFSGIHGLTVNPGIPTITLKSGHFADTFCNTNSTDPRCPDGADQIATSHIQTGALGTKIANGTDTYDYNMKVRDAYGNRVTVGNIKIKYITTIKDIQIDILDNSNYGPSIDGDSFISSELGSGLGGSVEKTMGISDTTYSIASTAPTNTTDNVIQLDSIKYNSGGVDFPLVPTGVALNFSPLYTASTTSPNPPVIGVPNEFLTSVTQNSPTLILPTIISTLQIGTGANAEWKDLGSDPIATCINYQGISSIDPLCDWNNVLDEKASIATATGMSFTFTGTYTTGATFTITEPTFLKNYVYYTGSLNQDILYLSATRIIRDASLTVPRIRIFGQTSEAMRAGSENRVNIINNLRQKIALLARNRTNYASTDYEIHIGDINVSNASFANKRTIITIGGNITIDDNIDLHDHPLALIALTNINNVGGNIRIGLNVSDIHSILIAENGITSEESNMQLYIHGSIVSANPPQEVTPTTCPFFASGCTPSDYDLPYSRRNYSIQSIGGFSFPNSFIIAIDTRLVSDPPPALRK